MENVTSKNRSKLYRNIANSTIDRIKVRMLEAQSKLQLFLIFMHNEVKFGISYITFCIGKIHRIVTVEADKASKIETIGVAYP